VTAKYIDNRTKLLLAMADALVASGTNERTAAVALHAAAIRDDLNHDVEIPAAATTPTEATTPAAAPRTKDPTKSVALTGAAALAAVGRGSATPEEAKAAQNAPPHRTAGEADERSATVEAEADDQAPGTAT
jgi:hypothetical protein